MTRLWAQLREHRVVVVAHSYGAGLVAGLVKAGPWACTHTQQGREELKESGQARLPQTKGEDPMESAARNKHRVFQRQSCVRNI